MKTCSANGNRTERLPVQASSVQSKCLQTRSTGIAMIRQKAPRIRDVVTRLSLGGSPTVAFRRWIISIGARSCSPSLSPATRAANPAGSGVASAVRAAPFKTNLPERLYYAPQTADNPAPTPTLVGPGPL